jgi:O-methyltransferase involved in polyketide biosynthesis
MSAISPTAHYTGYVWARNGLSHPELETCEGRLLFESLQPAMMLNGALGGGTLEAYLLARHLAIDALLERGIEHDGVNQVIEVACGLSPRGWRFTEQYPELIYVEADLPEMVERKRQALLAMGSLSGRHRVAEVDALREDDLTTVAGELDPRGSLAIIAEGLLSYLPPAAVDQMWQRFARVLGGFAAGRYLSDLHLGVTETPQRQVFRALLSTFVRGRVYVHFRDGNEATAALARAGFASAEVVSAGALLDTGDEIATRTHILEASTR